LVDIGRRSLLKKWIVVVVIITCLAVLGVFYKPYDSQTIDLQLPKAFVHDQFHFGEAKDIQISQ